MSNDVLKWRRNTIHTARVGNYILRVVEPAETDGEWWWHADLQDPENAPVGQAPSEKEARMEALLAARLMATGLFLESRTTTHVSNRQVDRLQWHIETLTDEQAADVAPTMVERGGSGL